MKNLALGSEGQIGGYLINYLKKKTGLSTIIHLLYWKLKVVNDPPHMIKALCVKTFQERFGCPVFIETGTYHGDMVKSVRKDFHEIYSIELGETLFINACTKFSDFSHIHIIRGDSSRVLPELISPMKTKCLFWLDAHYSKGNTAKGSLDCPIIQELEIIKDHSVKNHIILIDDARLFNGENGWALLEDVLMLLKKINANYKIVVKDDIIRAYIED